MFENVMDDPRYTNNLKRFVGDSEYEKSKHKGWLFDT